MKGKKNAKDLARTRGGSEGSWTKASYYFTNFKSPCTDRLIQRCFVRALRRNADEDVDKTMIPQDILAWYGDEDDEEDTFE